MIRAVLVLCSLPFTALAADAGTAPPNAVQQEMQLLHAMMVAALTAIENGNLAAIPPALEQVHAAKEQTEAALKSGAWVPPRPGTTVKDFVKQDEAFHKELEKLEALVEKNDLAGASKQYGAVLNGCTACHQKFKFTAPPAYRSK